MPTRTPEQIQREIEEARDGLAGALDQLAVRTNPKRLANDAKESLVAKAKSPIGLAVIGVSVAGIALLVAKNLRRSRG